MILQFAWRYFKGKKSTQAIQIISWVSVGAMAIGTAALLIVLSVFNGFEGFIQNLYTSFYPAIKITASVGKTFQLNDSTMHSLLNINGVHHISKCLEENVLFSYNESQVIATIKGVDSNYKEVTNMSEKVRYGKMDFSQDYKIPPIVLGIGISNRLGASEESHLPITCYAFSNHANVQSLDPTSIYSSSLFEVRGVYVLQDEIDNQYVFAPLYEVQQLLQKQEEVSSLEVLIDSNTNAIDIQHKMQELTKGEHLKIETRYEQNKTLYFILKSERWAVFAILTLMLMIASFNIVGSMSMLVIDKKKDIGILKAMGMKRSMIKKIFLSTGVLLSFIGASIGCVIAFVVCALQQYVGFVKLGGGGSFLIEAYPVKMHVSDFVLVLVTVVIIALFASWIPSIRASQGASVGSLEH